MLSGVVAAWGVVGCCGGLGCCRVLWWPGVLSGVVSAKWITSTEHLVAAWDVVGWCLGLVVEPSPPLPTTALASCSGLAGVTVLSGVVSAWEVGWLSVQMTPRALDLAKWSTSK